MSNRATAATTTSAAGDPTTRESAEAEAAAAVELRGLTHRYGPRRALDDVSLEVGRGELFALLGPNGGGKTTLFRILSTLMRPGGGAARVFAADVAREPHAVRASIGVTFQSPSLDRVLTVRENLVAHGHIYGLGGAALRSRIGELLDVFRIRERADDRVSTLSGGLARRVEIAKAMMHHPRLLMLDEPSTGLDPRARHELLTELRGLAPRGVTVFLTTHLMEEAEKCDRVAILDRGRLVGIGTPAELCRAIGGDVVTIEADDPAGLARHIEATQRGVSAPVIDGKVRVEHPSGHTFVVSVIGSFAGRINAVQVGRPTLADVFLHSTGRAFDAGAEQADGADDPRKRR